MESKAKCSVQCMEIKEVELYSIGNREITEGLVECFLKINLKIDEHNKFGGHNLELGDYFKENIYIVGLKNMGLDQWGWKMIKSRNY